MDGKYLKDLELNEAMERQTKTDLEGVVHYLLEHETILSSLNRDLRRKELIVLGLERYFFGQERTWFEGLSILIDSLKVKLDTWV